MTSTLPKLFVLITIVRPYSGQIDYCREGTYGNSCQLNCPDQCRPLQTFPCHKETGRCSEGCNHGYYGDKCDQRCSCPSGICYQATGDCYDTDTTTVRTIQTTTNRVENLTRVPLQKPYCEVVGAVWRITTICLIILIQLKKHEKIYKVTSSTEEVLCIPEKPDEEATGVQNEKIRFIDDSPEKNQPLFKSSEEKEGEKKIKELKKEQPLFKSSEEKEGEKKIKELKKENRFAEGKRKEMERTISRYEYRENEIHTLLGLPSSSTNSKFSTNHLMSNKGLNNASWLHCPPLKFDTETVNVKVARIVNNMALKNSPDPRPPGNKRRRFQHFQGTTSTEPLVKTGLSQYFEVVVDIDVKQPVGEGEVVMQLAFCREENRDRNPFIEYKKNNCFVVKAVSCKKHQKICLVSTQDGKKEHLQQLMNNVRGARTKVNIGIRLDKDMMEMGVFDCLEDKLLPVSDIIIGEKIWPMFGVCAGSEASVTIQLNAGRDIEMGKKKKEVIKTKFM